VSNFRAISFITDWFDRGKTIMAEIFRARYYVDPTTGKRCSKDTPGAVEKRAEKFTIRYYRPDGRRLKAIGYADKKATETLAGELRLPRPRTEALGAGYWIQLVQIAVGRGGGTMA
jgi:hypothetical protein